MKPDDSSDCTFSLKFFLVSREKHPFLPANEPVNKASNILCGAGEMASD